MPGWVTTTRFSRSISRIWSIFVSAIVRPPSIPAAPPLSPVPAPRGTIGIRCSAAEADEGRDLGGRRRQGHGQGQAGLEVGGLVVAVALAVRRVVEEPQVRQRGPDRGEERRPGGVRRRVRDRRRGHGPSLRIVVASSHGRPRRSGGRRFRLAAVASSRASAVTRPDPRPSRSRGSPRPDRRRHRPDRRPRRARGRVVDVGSGRADRARRRRSPRHPGCRSHAPADARPDPGALARSGLHERAAPGPELVFGEAASRGITAGARPGLLPGSVNATTMALTATYDVKASLNFGTRAFKASTTIRLRNDSGGPIDRLELNTIATRLGGMKLGAVTSAGQAGQRDGPRPDDPRAARRDPRNWPVGDRHGRLLRRRSAARRPARTGCSRGRTASPTSTAGSRG